MTNESRYSAANINPNEKVTLIDTTLREGEQSPGVMFSVKEKLELLEHLLKAGIRSFDACFPEAGEHERTFLKQAVVQFPEAAVAASCRLKSQAIADALTLGASQVYVICPVSYIHLKTKWGITEAELTRRVEKTLDTLPKTAIQKTNLVLEDSARAKPKFCISIVKTARQLGVKNFFLSDTVGAMTPWKTAEWVQLLLTELSQGENLGVHFHNDFGLAVANTLAAFNAGARKLTASLNGIGERAGIADLAVVVAGLKFLLHKPVDVNVKELIKLSEKLAAMTGILIPQHHPLTGYNAFTHCSGIHVDAVLKTASTYEMLPPEAVGRQRRLALGKLSGRHHLAFLLDKKTDDSTVQELYVRLKEYSDSLGPARKDANALFHRLTEFNKQHMQGIDIAQLQKGKKSRHDS